MENIGWLSEGILDLLHRAFIQVQAHDGCNRATVYYAMKKHAWHPLVGQLDFSRPGTKIVLQKKTSGFRIQSVPNMLK